MNFHKYSCGFIGMGKMAEAILNGILRVELLPDQHIRFVEVRESRRGYIEENYPVKSASLEYVLDTCDVLIFCIKPFQIKEILSLFPKKGLNEKLIISILAGTSYETFKSGLNQHIQFCRVMPNTPALLLKGMSALYCSPGVEPFYKTFAFDLFSSLGRVIEVADEQLLNVVTGLSGSGPAFFYRIAGAMAKEAEAMGLNYPDALTSIAQTLIGAGEMLLHSGESPETLVKNVTTPNGTTEAGLKLYDKYDLDTGLRAVIKRAADRSFELGRISD